MVKYVYYDSRNEVWRVSKRINGKQTLFGTYNTEEEAALAAELFEKTGWHKEDNWVIKAEVKEKLKN